MVTGSALLLHVSLIFCPVACWRLSPTVCPISRARVDSTQSPQLRTCKTHQNSSTNLVVNIVVLSPIRTDPLVISCVLPVDGYNMSQYFSFTSDGVLYEFRPSASSANLAPGPRTISTGSHGKPITAISCLTATDYYRAGDFGTFLTIRVKSTLTIINTELSLLKLIFTDVSRIPEKEWPGSDCDVFCIEARLLHLQWSTTIPGEIRNLCHSSTEKSRNIFDNTYPKESKQQ